MMAFVFTTSITLATWHSGSFLMFQLVYGCTIILLLTSIIAAKYGETHRKRFWFGFAVYGWGYLLLAYSPWGEWARARPQGQSLPVANPLLPLNGLITRLAEVQTNNLNPNNDSRNYSGGVPNRVNVTQKYIDSWEKYTDYIAFRVGLFHMYFVWIFGAIGGATTKLIVGRRAEQVKLNHLKSKPE